MIPTNAITKHIFLGGADPVSVYPYATKIWYVFGRSDDFVLCDGGSAGYFSLGNYATSIENTEHILNNWDCPVSLSVVKSNATDGQITIIYLPATTTPSYNDDAMVIYDVGGILFYGIVIFFVTFFGLAYYFKTRK